MGRTFTLQAVLALRHRAEEAEERALAAISVEREHVRTMLERVRTELQQWTSDRLLEAGRAVQAAQRQAQYARLRALQEARGQLEEQLSQFEGRLRTQQQMYLAARRTRETLEELKEQQRLAFQAEERRREQKQADDLFILKRYRR